jgi:predicted DNA-binding protein YlxM (UPF0122 family)
MSVLNLTKEELYNLYINKKFSTIKISKLYNCSVSTVWRKLKKFNIEIREPYIFIKTMNRYGKNNHNFIDIDKEQLNDLYTNKKLSMLEIRKNFNCSDSTITRKLLEFNIPMVDRRVKNGKPRCISCGKELSNYGRTRCRECFGKTEIGKGNPNYKDGSSSLYYLIRGLKNSDNWRISVFERDNYTCQVCGDNVGGNLEAHHIKSFNKIFLKFLKEYDQFSKIEDKETLVRLAIKYEPFCDISNGQTLCVDCHKKTNSYGKQRTIIKDGK